MCRYCDLNYKETPRDMSAEIEQYGKTYGLTLTIHGEVYAIGPIEYCPMCGRKLTEEEDDV